MHHLAVLRDHDSHNTSAIRIQQVMITTVIHSAVVQKSALFPVNHASRSITAGTAVSLAATCFACVIAGRARTAREMYSVSSVSFGAELFRPQMCLMLNESHNIVTRFPSRCFVIKSAGLVAPRMLSILCPWFFSFCCSQKYLVSMCLMGPLPLRKASPPCCCSTCPDSYVSFVSQLS